MYSYLYGILVDDSTDTSLLDGTSILKTPNVQLMYHIFAFNFRLFKPILKGLWQKDTFWRNQSSLVASEFM